jgi:hypothetical protein
MSVEECVSPEELAQLFHRYHGVLTGCFDGRTSTAPWNQVDAHQRRLLIATARLVLSDLAAKQQAGESQEAREDDSAAAHAAHPDPANRRYYAKPGQAEWGC